MLTYVQGYSKMEVNIGDSNGKQWQRQQLHCAQFMPTWPELCGEIHFVEALTKECKGIFPAASFGMKGMSHCLEYPWEIGELSQTWMTLTGVDRGMVGLPLLRIFFSSQSRSPKLLPALVEFCRWGPQVLLILHLIPNQWSGKPLLLVPGFGIRVARKMSRRNNLIHSQCFLGGGHGIGAGAWKISRVHVLQVLVLAL